MAPWFEDKNNSGEELKALYDEFLGKENKRERMKKFQDFYDVYRKALQGKENWCKEISGADEKLISGKLPSFMVYMSQIVTENLRASIHRLGVWNSIKYGLNSVL